MIDINEEARLYERMYRGKQYEYFVLSKFWGMGYEAFGYPVDFGFDLKVNNDKQRLFYGRNSDEDDRSYLIQVKSCHINDFKEVPETSVAGVRYEGRAKFYFNKSELNKITATDNAAVVLVFAKARNENNPLAGTEYDTSILGYCWLNSKNIRHLIEKSAKDFFYDTPHDSDKLLLNATIRLDIDGTKRIKLLIAECLQIIESMDDKDSNDTKSINNNLIKLSSSLAKGKFLYGINNNIALHDSTWNGYRVLLNNRLSLENIDCNETRYYRKLFKHS